MEEEGPARWGTWEELLLGGAVLRHGTAAWDSVSAELRARTPSLFTSQECEAKYEDLLEQYSGCDAWFEELRKRRVAELRRELERSEDSIGTLQTKLKSLSAERGSCSSFEDDTPRTESPSPTENVDGVDSSSKEASRDGSSAGSYTGETGRDWSQECRILASVSSQESDIRVDLCENSGKETSGSRDLDIGPGVCRKKRGQRKRRGCNVVKKGSVGESSMVGMDRDPLGCDQDVIVVHKDVGAPHEDVKAPREDSGGHIKCDDGSLDLVRIVDSIMEHKDVSIFRRRLEIQKRARYKKMIRRHVDFRDISLRISDGSLSSAKELFRDLLLLANNTLVFYPKNSNEHRAAIKLRNLVIKTLRDPTSSNDGGAASIQVGSEPAKLQTLHACNRSTPGGAVVGGKAAGPPTLEKGKRGGRSEEPAEAPARKRGRGRAVKGGGRGSGKRRCESPNKGRKRARR